MSNDNYFRSPVLNKTVWAGVALAVVSGAGAVWGVVAHPGLFSKEWSGSTLSLILLVFSFILLFIAGVLYAATLFWQWSRERRELDERMRLTQETEDAAREEKMDAGLAELREELAHKREVQGGMATADTVVIPRVETDDSDVDTDAVNEPDTAATLVIPRVDDGDDGVDSVADAGGDTYDDGAVSVADGLAGGTDGDSETDTVYDEVDSGTVGAYTDEGQVESGSDAVVTSPDDDANENKEEK